MVGGDLKMVERRPGIGPEDASCSSSFELCSRKKEAGELSVRERGKISGGRLGIGTRMFDAGDGRRVASHAGDDARRAATGATGLTGRSYRSEPGTLHSGDKVQPELGLGPCRAGLARPSRASCCVGSRFLGTIGTSCRAVLARQVYYQAQARPMARRHAFVPCRPKHGPPYTCNWIYMHRYRNITIAIRKHINYRCYENYMIF